jgi:hypothetical protein
LWCRLNRLDHTRRSTPGPQLQQRVIRRPGNSASAPLKVLQAKFGFTVENIVATARTQLGLEHDTDTPGVTLETSETSETIAQ